MTRPIPARRSGVSGFMAIALGLPALSDAELLDYANRARFDGYDGAAECAYAELNARAELDPFSAAFARRVGR